MADVKSSPPLYVFLLEIKHAGKCVEQLTQAKYESNARGEGSDLAPLNPLLPSRIQNISKLQGWKNSSFLQFWLTARISKNIISFIFKIS